MDCWAWVLSPLPRSSVDAAESFVRIRLVGPRGLLHETGAALVSLGGSATPPEPALPPLQDRLQTVLAGTLAAFQELTRHGPPLSVRAIEDALNVTLGELPPAVLGAHRFDVARRVYVAGILNNTPDSFFDRGRHFGLDAALARADEIVRQGADVIEVGGETAQAGERLPAAEEIGRVVPVVEALVRRFPLPVAVDTYKPEVARAAIAAGAVLINDIAGLGEPGMTDVIAGSHAGVVIMHLHGRPREPYADVDVPSMMDWVAAFLRQRVGDAIAAGIPRHRIFVDPGLNFGKRPHRDLELMQRLPELRNLGCPIFVATSRKDYIRDLLGLPPDELLEGTAAAVAFAVVQGANMLRVHDVQAMVRVVRMTEFLVGHNKTEGAVPEEAHDVTAH